MRSHGSLYPYLYLFLWFVLLGFDGPGAHTAEHGPAPSDTREASAPMAGAGPAALPAGRWLPSDESRQDLDAVPATPVAPASEAAPPSPGLRSQAAAWLNFRRPFAETVSYRTTAPPSRII